ncbi:MAG: penicillin-binding protein 2 [Acidimicrobiia bacterium]|nr:penicillin-binding protein 2 [Acidimicrobiia bacterium]
MAAKPAARRLSAADLRLWLLGFVLVIGWVGLGYRLFQVQVVRAEEFQQGGLVQRLETRSLAPDRGTIFDRNGDPLAMTIEADSIWVVPQQVTDPVYTAQSVAALTGRDWEVMRDAIQRGLDSGTRFVYLARQVEPTIAQAVMDLALPGVATIPEAKRVYPSGTVSAHVVGMVDIDGNGIEGLEISYEDELTGTPGQMVFEEDPAGKIIPQATREVVPAVPGDDLLTTLDLSLQYTAYEACEAAVERTRAEGCWIVALHAETGEVLAMVGHPPFDPEVRSGPDGAPFSNFAVRGMYEPGSTQKLITFAAAIDQGVIQPSTVIGAVADRYETTPGACKSNDDDIYGCFSDFTNHATVDMTVSDIFTESSNVGTIKIQEMLASGTMLEYMTRFGYGNATGIDYTGEAKGLVNNDPGCSSCLASTAIGYNVAVTPLQIAAAYAAIANDGMWVEPRLVSATVDMSGTLRTPAPQTRRVVTENTSWVMRQLLANVVESGTGKLASVPGYRVGGKTGTANKLGPDGTYTDKTVASFVGMAPIDDPKVVIAVVVDNPAWEYRTGGSAAAPAFAEVMEAALHALGVVPDAFDG